ncbi:uncharacterized protein [Typha angustifolia]|uniref:uncharacterized protein n=1 Tax=Typha angustifolia TaxID=59011 RepID=UPI003C3019A8
MVRWLRPKTPSELQDFLGSTGYYRRFIQGYGKIAAPLTAILLKGRFKWDDKAERPFEDLKQAQIEAPILELPDFHHDLCFRSIKRGAPTPPTDNYGDITGAGAEGYERQRIQTLVQQRWLSMLLGFDCDFVYKNGGADELSCQLEAAELATLFIPTLPVLDQVTDATLNEPSLAQLAALATQDPSSQIEDSTTDGLVLKWDRMQIPKYADLQTNLISNFHDSALAGHEGIFRTHKRL